MLSRSEELKIFPLMMCFIAGVSLIALSLVMDYALKFSAVDPLGLGASWQFGPRELVHFSGSLGAVFISWPILQVIINAKINKIICFGALLYFLLAMIAQRFLVYGESEFRYLLWGGSYTAFLIVMLMLNCIKGRSLSASWILLFAACFIELFNLWWELFQQPYLGFRGNAPSGSLQPAQIACDFLGVSVGLLFSFLILKFSPKW